MSNALTTLTGQLAQRFDLGVDGKDLVSTLKATAFRVNDGEVSDAQMTALLIVANQYGLNPWTKEVYAFPDKKNGIIPVVGVDGWSRIINGHLSFDGMEFNLSSEVVTLPGAKPCPEWMECSIFRKDRSHPIVIREYLDEVYREAFKGKYGDVTGPWQSHTKRMLRHKTMIQAARLAFSFAGIYDEDEAQRISDSEIDVTPQKAQAPAALPVYTEEAFQQNIGTWSGLISRGAKTPEQIIALLASKYTVSESHRQAISALQPAIEGELA